MNFSKILGYSALLYAACGLILRLGLKDGHKLSAPLFYATPWFLIVVALVIACRLVKAKRPLWLILLAGSVAFWLMNEFRFSSNNIAVSPEATRIVFWNLNRPETHPKSALLEIINRQQPQVVAVLETEHITPKEAETYKTILSGWHVLVLPRSMACFSKFPINYIAASDLGGQSYANHVVIHAPQGDWHLWITDLHAIPTRDRFAPLAKLKHKIDNNPNSIIVGDFNTPADSRAFEPWRNHFQNAWDKAGSGFQQTWPYGIPVHALDQAWADEHWKILSFTKGHQLRGGSDHAWLCFDVQLN